MKGISDLSSDMRSLPEVPTMPVWLIDIIKLAIGFIAGLVSSYFAFRLHTRYAHEKEQWKSTVHRLIELYDAGREILRMALNVEKYAREAYRSDNMTSK